MPSWSNPCSSVRSICLELASSRIALRISPDPKLISCPLAFPPEDQPRLADVCQRDPELRAALLAHHGHFHTGGVVHPDHLNLHPPAQRRSQHLRCTPGEAAPVGRVPKRALQPRRRDLEHIVLSHKPRLIQPGFDRLRDQRTILDGHASSVAAVDADVDQGTPLHTTPPELNQVIAKPVNFLVYKGFQRLVHVESRLAPKDKKMWGPSPHFQALPGIRPAGGNLPAARKSVNRW